jgi:hypothetical protein
MKLLFDRPSSIPWLSGIGIPLAILLTGWIVSHSIEQMRLQSEYVKVALGVLNHPRIKPVTKEDEDALAEQKVLRGWAVRLLSAQSPEKLSEREQEILIEGRVPFSGYDLSGGDFDYDFRYTYDYGHRIIPPTPPDPTTAPPPTSPVPDAAPNPTSGPPGEPSRPK